MKHGNAKDAMTIVIMTMMCYDDSYHVHDGTAEDAMIIVIIVMMVS